MSGRNRGPPHAALPPPMRDSPYGRGHGPMPHPAYLDEMRESRHGMGPPPRSLPPPHPAIIEEHLAAQLQDIQGLLVDNQRLAATHVALKQELEAAQFELQRMAYHVDSLQPEKDVEMRELYDKSLRLEVECHGFEAMRAELHQIRGDIKELTVARQELSGQAQAMTQDLARMNADLQQAPTLRAEIESMKQELQRARAAIEYEKKGYAENYEHGQQMEKNLISMAKELEKLRAEIANTEKKARAAVVPVNAVGGYNTNYGNPEAGYAVNPYGAAYGMNPVQNGAENFPQYPMPGHPGAWGLYDMQRAQGHR